MLKNIEIENFKCFKKQEIDFEAITVLVGANGGGKSTVIQSLLLARQLIEKHQDSQISMGEEGYDVLLNNTYMMQLGKAHSIYNNHNENREISLKLANEDGHKVNLSFTYDGKPATHILQGNVHYESRTLPALSGSVRYLHAERLGPRKALEMGPSTRINIGHQGEYVSHAIYNADENKVDVHENLVLDPKSAKFSHHVENWMEFIFPSIKLQYDTVDNQNMVETSFSNITTDQVFISPPNTGFGISYTLPIVVAGLLLSTEESPILIVENPEAHLHPLGQSRMGRFLAALTLAGVQVIIETHSEHIINGIRIFMAGKKMASNLNIHFFTHDEVGIQIEKLSLKENGELSNWPKGFFDQEQEDLYELLKIKREQVKDR